MNGCHNRAPYPQALVMVDAGANPWEPRKVIVPFAFTRECNYTHTDLGKADKGCTGCKWRNTGE